MPFTSLYRLQGWRMGIQLHFSMLPSQESSLLPTLVFVSVSSSLSITPTFRLANFFCACFVYFCVKKTSFSPNFWTFDVLLMLVLMSLFKFWLAKWKNRKNNPSEGLFWSKYLKGIKPKFSAHLSLYQRYLFVHFQWQYKVHANEIKVMYQ